MTTNHDSRRNILLVANWPSDVGYAWWLMETFWVAIAELGAQRGQRVVLAYPELRELPASIAASSAEVVEFGLAPGEQLASMARFLRQHDIGHVYLTDWPSYSISYLAMRQAGVRSIAVHDHTPGDRPSARQPARAIKQALHSIRCWSADRYLCVTEFVQQRYVHNACVPVARTRVARNGIHPVPIPAMADVHRLFEIPEGVPVIVMAGRANRYKGVDFVLRCAHALLERGVKNWHLLVVGDGPHLDEFIELAGTLSITDQTTFARQRNDLRDFLGSCDIGIQASQGEVGYSLTILEFMSAGLATLVPDLPSTRAATRHMATGCIFEPGNVDAATDLLARLLDDRLLRRRLGAAAHTETATHYRIEDTTRGVVDALADLFI